MSKDFIYAAAAVVLGAIAGAIADGAAELKTLPLSMMAGATAGLGVFCLCVWMEKYPE